MMREWDISILVKQSLPFFRKNDPGNVDSASQDYQKFLHLHQNYVEKNAIQKKQEPPN